MPSGYNDNVGLRFRRQENHLSIDTLQVEFVEPFYPLPYSSRYNVLPVIEDYKIMTERFNGTLHILCNGRKVGVMIAGKEYLHSHCYEILITFKAQASS